LPELDEEYQLRTEDIEGYQKNGHAILRGVAAEHEIVTYRERFVLGQTLC
jgi:hypothetical protein